MKTWILPNFQPNNNKSQKLFCKTDEERKFPNKFREPNFILFLKLKSTLQKKH